MLTKRIMITVLIPAYNEEVTILEVLKRLKALREKFNLEIILVDDGSTDRTYIIAKKLSQIKIIRLSRNYGKGAAIISGLKYCNGQIIVIQDADLEYPPENIPKIVEPIINKNADVVYGSRFLGQRPKMKALNFLGNRILSSIASILYQTQISDIMTGHKAIRKEVLRNIILTKRDFEIEVEMTAKFLLSKYKILEKPIVYMPRKMGKSKMKLRHGLTSLVTLFTEKLKWIIK